MTDKEANLVDLRVRLNKAQSEKFLGVKKYIGFENNTDVMRWLIHEKYEEIKFKLNKEETQE